jgi:tRNA pseudouridine13 synthase
MNANADPENGSLRAPFAPPLATVALTGVGGRIGSDPEDFVVDEVPLYAASGSGEHTYVRLRKRNVTTRDAVRDVARAAGIDARDIGVAGMKDKRAVTTQWLEILEVSRHSNKLRTGHLAANRFSIRLVDVGDGAERRARSIFEHIAAHGLPNRFGAQRFGRGGENLSRALEWIEKDAGPTPPRVPPFEKKLWSSVLQAEAFNRYLTERVALGFEAPLAGEVVRLEGTSSLFVVEDPEQEGTRWEARDIHPTGPIFGPKMRAAQGTAFALEEAAISAVGIRPEARERLGRHADGTRRDVLVWPKDVRATPRDDDSLVVEFCLPSGSYATELIRELTRSDFSDDGRA